MRGQCVVLLGLVLSGLMVGSPNQAQEMPARSDAPVLTPTTLQAALAAQPTGEEADRLAQRVRSWFGKDALFKGPGAKTEERVVAWAIEAPHAKTAPRVVSPDETFVLALTRLGTGALYVGATTLPDGAALQWAYQVDGERLGANRRLEVYAVHRDSIAQPGVPTGTLTQPPVWKSTIFPGTERDWWVYVPTQYKPEQPACVLVFQDGGGAKNFVPTVLDNLIAKGEIPVTVGIFINPGVFPDKTLPDGKKRSNRSFEYDTLSGQYARFLLEEILPEVEKTIKLRHDPQSRAIAGASSGGICAWTVAWERPDQFGKVISWIGSFTNIASGATAREGGHNYPALIRKLPPKPIRVFLQDGANDLDNIHGSWWLANQQMAKSLAYASYDYRFVGGNGFHSNQHGRAILPDTLRWLWRDHALTTPKSAATPDTRSATSRTPVGTQRKSD